ncbi:hypothetical protein N9M26_01255 [Alphaproteobacteria bacterium]|jgi:hypothetical protein|nr:hypothetical protein [Alphaproteobacteria bacterium]
MNFYDKLIQRAEELHGKDSDIANSFKKDKEISELNKGKSYRELYAERSTFTVGHKNKKVKKSLL